VHDERGNTIRVAARLPIHLLLIADAEKSRGVWFNERKEVAHCSILADGGKSVEVAA
jgi:hypothetical protein